MLILISEHNSNNLKIIKTKLENSKKIWRVEFIGIDKIIELLFEKAK
jgi:hypothetical protein